MRGRPSSSSRTEFHRVGESVHMNKKRTWQGEQIMHITPYDILSNEL